MRARFRAYRYFPNPLGNVTATVNCSLAYNSDRPAAAAMLRIVGERIATPVCALVRNDTVIKVILTCLGADSLQNSMSLRGAKRRGNPYPRHP